MLNARLYLRNKPDKLGMCRVYIYIYVEAANKYLETPVKILPVHWDPIKRSVRPSHPEASDLNLLLNQSLAKLNEIAISHRLAEKPMSYDNIKRLYESSESSANFISWWRDELKKRESENISMNTLDIHRSILNKLSEWCKGKLHFHEINDHRLSVYEKHLKSSRGNSVNTIYNNMRIILRYLARASREGLVTRDKFRNYKLKKERPTKDYLNEQEMDYAFNCYAQMDECDKKKILRAFLFSCCTGLRISDLKLISFSNVVGGKLLVFSMFKTKNTAPMTVRVPLTKTALSLIEDTGRKRGTLFWFPDNDSYANKLLKQSLPEIDKERIHFHTGRHTFATHYLRRNKRDIVTLQTLLGHSKIEQTMEYIYVDDDWLFEGMAGFGEWI